MGADRSTCAEHVHQLLAAVLDQMLQPAAVVESAGTLLATNERWQRLMPSDASFLINGRDHVYRASNGHHRSQRRLEYSATDRSGRRVLLLGIALPAIEPCDELQLLLVDRRRHPSRAPDDPLATDLDRRRHASDAAAPRRDLRLRVRVTTGGSRAFTPRERQVARFIAAGYRNGEIAAALGMQPSTARRHTERILYKLGVSNRAAAAAMLTG